VCREALALARRDGLRVKLLVPHLLHPVADEVYRDFFESARAGLVVEQSHQGQLYRLLRMYLDVPPGVVSLARPGANPFPPAEVVSRLRELAAVLQQGATGGVQPAE
jgi:2-oxoglutarate ferredoxin oxidoreductase subunit alpha